MPRPTLSQLAHFLDNLAIGGVDPNSFLRGTVPEILRITANAGRLAPHWLRSFNQNLLISTSATPVVVTNLVTPGAAEIAVVSRMYVRILSANIDEIRFLIRQGGSDFVFYDDDTGAPFPLQQYIGADTSATERFHSINQGKIQVMGRDVPTVDGTESLMVGLISAGAVSKSIRLNFRVDVYFVEDFPGW